MSTVLISVTTSGASDAEDARAARFVVGLRNAEITAENAVLAAQTPPGTPIPLLPTTPAAALKASTEAVYTRTMQLAHLSYVKEAKDAATKLTEDQKRELGAAVVDLLNGGQTYSQVLARLA